jgi:hypothetical protein
MGRRPGCRSVAEVAVKLGCIMKTDLEFCLRMPGRGIRKSVIVILGLLVLWIDILPAANGQAGASTQNLYQITGGSYTMIGGIWAEITMKLPGSDQAFIALSTDGQQGKAGIFILGEDQETVFLKLTNGIITGEVIHFQYKARHPFAGVEELGTVDYSVTNRNGMLAMGGGTEFPPICCDIPYEFSHSNVVATAMPVATLRVSEVELSWSSVSHQSYQVQYQSELTTNQWVNLGSPVMGTDARTSILDKVAADQPRRFYRVIVAP